MESNTIDIRSNCKLKLASSDQARCHLSFTLFFFIVFFCNSRVECTNYSVGLEKLIDTIFTQNAYNQLVRPTDPETGLTVVFTELKMLQIDLVCLKKSHKQMLFKLRFFLIAYFKSGWEIPRVGFHRLDWNGK